MAEGIQIAIDGPASSGKGTVARVVAEALDYAYVDTGAMYRAVAFLCEERGVSWADEQAIAVLLQGWEFSFDWVEGTLDIQVNGRSVSGLIRSERIGAGASAVAVLPAVRSGLLERQRELAGQGRVVMDGRDIGSVVLPKADLKIFLDANVEERASRRFMEMSRKGIDVTLDAVREDLIARDAQDRNRIEAPLIQADDAIYLDTSGLTADAAAAEILKLAAKHI